MHPSLGGLDKYRIVVMPPAGVSAKLVIADEGTAMTNKLLDACKNMLTKCFAKEDINQEERIQSARITSTRLQALERLRENSPCTPEYKLKTTVTQTGRSCDDLIDLDFGM